MKPVYSFITMGTLLKYYRDINNKLSIILSSYRLEMWPLKSISDLHYF